MRTITTERYCINCGTKENVDVSYGYWLCAKCSNDKKMVLNFNEKTGKRLRK